jgi:hypothetical protein
MPIYSKFCIGLLAQNRNVVEADGAGVGTCFSLARESQLIAPPSDKV